MYPSDYKDYQRCTVEEVLVMRFPRHRRLRPQISFGSPSVGIAFRFANLESDLLELQSDGTHCGCMNSYRFRYLSHLEMRRGTEAQ